MNITHNTERTKCCGFWWGKPVEERWRKSWTSPAHNQFTFKHKISKYPMRRERLWITVQSFCCLTGLDSHVTARPQKHQWLRVASPTALQCCQMKVVHKYIQTTCVIDRFFMVPTWGTWKVTCESIEWISFILRDSQRDSFPWWTRVSSLLMHSMPPPIWSQSTWALSSQTEQREVE